MIPLILSLVFGVGIYLAYEGLTNRIPAGSGALHSRGALGALGVEGLFSQMGLGDVPPKDFALFSLGSGLLLGVLAQLFLGWIVVSLVAFLLGCLAPLVYHVQRSDRRRASVQVALVEAITQLRDSIRAGLAVQEALANLARSGPETLRPELAQLAREMRLLGFSDALLGMRDRLADPVFDVVAQSLLVNDRLGGRNVSQVLDRLAHATREQLRIQEELRAYQARNVLSARIIALVPVVVLVVIRSMNPQYLAIFDTLWGQAILALCLLSTIVGYGAMLWTTRLPGERRVIR